MLNKLKKIFGQKQTTEDYIQKKSEEITERKSSLNEQADRNQKGMELEKEGKIEEAMSLYWENINEEFGGNHPYDRLAVLYRNQNNFEKEIEVLEKAIYVFENKVNKNRADRTRKLERFKERLEKVKELKG